MSDSTQHHTGSAGRSRDKVWAPGHWPGGQCCISREGGTEGFQKRGEDDQQSDLQGPQERSQASPEPLSRAPSRCLCLSQALGPKLPDQSDLLLWPPSLGGQEGIRNPQFNQLAVPGACAEWARVSTASRARLRVNRERGGRGRGRGGKQPQRKGIKKAQLLSFFLAIQSPDLSGGWVPTQVGARPSPCLSRVTASRPFSVAGILQPLAGEERGSQAGWK